MTESSYMTAPGATSESIKLRREMAKALMAKSMNDDPMLHWSQGVSRMGQAAIAGFQMRQANEDENAAGATQAEWQAKLLESQRGGAASPVSPVAAALAPSTPNNGNIGPITSPQSAQVKDVYEPGEQTPFDPVPGAITPDRSRLLAALQPGESGGQPNVMYGGKTFDSYADHPRQAQPITSGPNAGKTSSGAGLYQFIAPTWDRAKNALGLKDFSPENQNAAAAYIAGDDYQKRTGKSLDLALTEAGNDPTKIAGIAKALAPTWTSLPGGIEPNGSTNQFVGNMQGGPSEASAQSRLPQPRTAEAPDSGAANPMTARVVEALRSKDPNIRKAAMGMAQGIIQQQMKPETTNDIKEYNRAQKDPAFAKYLDDRAAAKRQQQTINVGGGSDKQIFDSMDASTNAARTAATGLTGLREARAALNAGMISGAGADQVLGLQKVASAIGLANSDKIVNTETFRAAIAPQVAAMIKATVGTTNISNTDREFAEKAAGGNITLDEKSISRLLDIMERAGTGLVSSHQKRLEKVYPDAEKFARERALFGVDLPTDAPITPPKTQEAPRGGGTPVEWERGPDGKPRPKR